MHEYLLAMHEFSHNARISSRNSWLFSQCMNIIKRCMTFSYNAWLSHNAWFNFCDAWFFPATDEYILVFHDFFCNVWKFPWCMNSFSQCIHIILAIHEDKDDSPPYQSKRWFTQAYRWSSRYISSGSIISNKLPSRILPCLIIWCRQRPSKYFYLIKKHKISFLELLIWFMFDHSCNVH